MSPFVPGTCNLEGFLFASHTHGCLVNRGYLDVDPWVTNIHVKKEACPLCTVHIRQTTTIVFG